jgi:hypothetical protein
VAFPHRLSLAFTTDEDLMVNAEHIRFMCEGERISDWAGEAGRRLGGQTARAAYALLLDQLREAWTSVNAACRRLEHVGSPAVLHLTDQFLLLLERRYARFAIVLVAGPAREEILANVARQLGELRVFFAAFSQNLADRAGRLPYAEQAVFAGERYVNLFTPSMNFLLGEDGGSIPGGIRLGDGGCGGSSPAAGRSGRGILKPSSLAVSFTDPSVSPMTPPRPPPPPPPQSATWPYGVYQPIPPHLVNPYTPTPPPPPAGAAAWHGFGGPLGVTTTGPPAPAYSPPAAPMYSPPAAPAAAGVAIKSEPGGKTTGKGFAGQPMHAYVTGADCAVAPAGTPWMPPCGCANSIVSGPRPGPHATWDCPLRYIAKFGRCPGFLLTGLRDPAQWLPGDILTRAAKDDWLQLIAQHHLKLPREKDAHSPPFHL